LNTKRHLLAAQEKYNIDEYLSNEIYNNFLQRFQETSKKEDLLNNFKSQISDEIKESIEEV